MNRIKIDLDRRAGSIDRRVFGGFVEHLGRGIYGGIYEPTSPLADANGLRSDVRAALERLRLSIIRYPGGNFASGYQWRDGVGPREERPARIDLSWGAVEPNIFGTNEFITFCRTLGVEPYLVVNCGDGDLREAREWVEYCNGTADTTLTRLRAAHGYPTPHGVRYWGVGNEVDGVWQIGAKSPAEYARAYHEFAKAMRWTDPSIRLIAAATSDWEGDIVERVQLLVEEAADHIDYLALHWYVGDKDQDSVAYMTTSELIEERLSSYEGLLRGLNLGRRRRASIPLAVDEWNVWYRTAGAPAGTTATLEEVYDLQDALVVALHLNAFVRHARHVRMANLAQLVNVIAPIVTWPEGICLQTIFYPLELFAATVGSEALDAWWESDTFSGGGYSGVRWLDVSASLDPAANRLAVHVVNRHPTEALETTVELQGGRFAGHLQVSTVTGDDFHVSNTSDHPDAVVTTQRSLEFAPSDAFTCEVPPRSVNAFAFTV